MSKEPVVDYLDAVARFAAEERDTRGADAFWLLGLPSALLRSEENGKILDWAAARILGEVFGESRRPSPGLHTREIPGILTLQALDQEARAVAAFARGAFWCLSDLFPALGQYFEHPTLLRLDFSGVSFMDSSGIGLVMGRYRMMALQGGRVSVENVPEGLKKMMQLSGLGALGVLEEKGEVYETAE